MKSIFTRTYIVLIVLMTLGFVGSIILIADFSEDEGYADFSRNAKVEAYLFYESFSGKSTDELKLHASGYKTHYVTGLNLIEKHDLKSLEIELPEVIPESGTVNPKPDDGWIMVIPTQEPQLYLVIDDGLDFELFSPKIIASILFPFITMFTILGIAFWFISKHIARPINALSASVAQFGQGDLSSRVKPNKTEPIKTLCLGFNDMASQIQELINDYSVLLGAIPHELRTPVARTKFALSLSKNTQNQREHYKYIEHADGHLTELESIVDATLSFSKLFIEGESPSNKFSFKRLIFEEISALEANNLDIKLNYKINETVTGNSKVIGLAISNILRNAIKYSESKIHIDVSSSKEYSVVCSVSDDGEGIPPGEQKNVFKPFYRLDKSRSRKTGDLGLGLAIVELIARKIGGSASVEENKMVGATICFKWDGLQAH